MVGKMDGLGQHCNYWHVFKWIGLDQAQLLICSVFGF